MSQLTIEAEAPATGEPDAQPFVVTSELFFQMIEAGLFRPDCRVYLWDGRLYEAMAKTVPHATTTAAFVRALTRRLPPDWTLWPENPIALDRTRAPLPDFTVVRGEPFDYAAARRHPDPGDVGLLIEVAVTRLPKDLGVRLEAYARAMVSVYWVADVRGRRILVHTEPRIVDDRGLYRRVEEYKPGQSLPLILDGRELDRIPFEELLR